MAEGRNQENSKVKEIYYETERSWKLIVVRVSLDGSSILAKTNKSLGLWNPGREWPSKNHQYPTDFNKVSNLSWPYLDWVDDTFQTVVWSSLIEHGPLCLNLFFKDTFKLIFWSVISNEKFTQLLSKVVFNKLEFNGIRRCWRPCGKFSGLNN